MTRMVAPHAGWPGWARGRLLSRAGLAALLAGSGLLHLIFPAPYRRIVPGSLAFGRTHEIVLITGLLELACAVAILGRRTRRAGALATMALFVAVFPANLKMAVEAGLPERGWPRVAVLAAWLRLPLQVPLILWARSVGTNRVEARSLPPSSFDRSRR